jgi:hypothetical protein
MFLWGVVFIPHLFFSGFISDDWGVVRSGVGNTGFWNIYASLNFYRILNLAPEQCLVIGDRDGEAARRAGMNYIVVPKGLNLLRLDQLLENCCIISPRH